MFPTPEEAEYAFYEAMRQGDIALMMRVWSDDEDVACIHPGGLRTLGPRAVREGWEHIFANGQVAAFPAQGKAMTGRSEEHTSELQSRENRVCRLLLGRNN